MQPAEELEELIAHKLRFIAQKIRFYVAAGTVSLHAHPSPIFAEIAQKIGAVLLPLDFNQTEPTIFIYCIPGKTLAEAMGIIPEILQSSYLQANDKNKAYLLNEEWILQADTLSQLESLAEILYPNFFTFGYEGTAWVEFKA
jgi:iron complex transport system substrate-binding protein